MVQKMPTLEVVSGLREAHEKSGLTLSLKEAEMGFKIQLSRRRKSDATSHQFHAMWQRNAEVTERAG